MLLSLSIKNYALIKDLQINFENGYTAVTGETGAGKSIILGAMHLMLGQRADTSVITNAEQKCIAEGIFDLSGYKLQRLFERNELDYWDETILRREILPSGKSRAFINDTPVNLQLLKKVASKLIDIHSQSHNLEIEDKQFQLNVVDTYAKLEKKNATYRLKYDALQLKKKELDELKTQASQAKSEREFLQFQFEKLDEAKLTPNEECELEKEQNLLSHAGEIKTALDAVSQLLSNEEAGIIIKVNDAQRSVSNIAGYLKKAEEITERLESSKIELSDIAMETDMLNDTTEFDPERLNFVNERMSEIFSLKQKHQKDTVEELIALKESFEQKLLETDHLDQQISKREKEVLQLEAELLVLANELSEKRKMAFPKIENYVKSELKQLGIPNGTLSLDCQPLATPGKNGLDDITFMFSANKSHPVQALSNVASGGEKSRLMLVVKSLLAKNKNLPTIIFDEIDTGISGDIAQKLANQLAILSANMQLIAITHLPQVASRANCHLKVYKNETNGTTNTSIKILHTKDRIMEIAEMLSGKNPPEAAILNAKELLKN